MKTYKQKVLATIFMLAGFLVCVPVAMALYIQAYSVAGYALQTYPQQHDWTDGWNNDYVAQVYYANPGEPITVPGDDYAHTRASLTDSGVVLKNMAYAPDTFARSYAKITDYFTVTTITGANQSLLDAVLNFDLSGSITVFNALDSKGHFTLSMRAYQDDGSGGFGTILDIKDVDYTVEKNISGQYVGMNSNDLSYPYEVFPDSVIPTQSGLNYNFDVPLSLDLDDLLSDIPVRLELSLSVTGYNAIVDFYDTFASSLENPFIITSNLPGTSYRLGTGYELIDGVSLFGSLDGEIVTGGSTGGNTPIPEPSTFILLGGGLVGLAFCTCRRKNR